MKKYTEMRDASKNKAVTESQLEKYAREGYIRSSVIQHGDFITVFYLSRDKEVPIYRVDELPDELTIHESSPAMPLANRLAINAIIRYLKAKA